MIGHHSEARVSANVTIPTGRLMKLALFADDAVWLAVTPLSQYKITN